MSDATGPMILGAYTIDGLKEYVLPDKGHVCIAVKDQQGLLWGHVHPFYSTLWLLLSAGFCLLLTCSPAAGDDIFKPTGRYAPQSIRASVQLVKSKPLTKQVSNCPGGVCPTNRRVTIQHRSGRWFRR